MRNICTIYGEGDIALFKHMRFDSRLTGYLLFCVFISGLIGIVVGYLGYGYGARYIDQMAEDAELNQSIQKRYLEDLQQYVTENEVTAASIDDLYGWTADNTSVYVSIYQNRKIIFNSDNLYEASENEEEEYNIDELEDIFEGYLYRLVLADRSIARVDLFCYDIWTYYNYVWGAAVTVGIIIFTIILTHMIQRKIQYINGIVKELQILEGGNLEYPITIKGNDEIANLAIGIEQMRQSIIENINKEKAMLQSNRELVTSMSHDLRTPLTTLTGYLELLNIRTDLEEEKRRHYLELSLAKSLEIKQLSDDLFSYFLIYGENDKQIELEPVPMFALVEDLIHNQMLSLEEQGYTIIGNHNLSEKDGCCMIQTKYMQRVLNNIISNLKKYADQSVPIEITAEIDRNRFCMCVKNGISHLKEEHESTKIGLITCERILFLHGGVFLYYEEEETFVVKLEIPMEEKKC